MARRLACARSLAVSYQEAIEICAAIFDRTRDEAAPLGYGDARHRRDAPPRIIDEVDRLALVREAVCCERAGKTDKRRRGRRGGLSRKGRIIKLAYKERPCSRRDRRARREEIARPKR